MPHILILGGTGFVGQNLARDLANRGARVSVTTRKDTDATANILKSHSDLISVVRCDLSDDEQVEQMFARERFDAVVMLAQTHLHGTTRDVINQIYPMTLRCLEGARKAEIPRVILGSSISVYSGEEPPFSETARFSPDIVYGETTLFPVPKFEVWVKRIVEQLFLDYGTPLDVATGEAASVVDAPMEVGILRLSNQFGPGYAAGGSPLGIASHTAAGRIADLSTQVGYFGLPISALWNMAGVFPPSYVKDSASALSTLVLADHVPHRIYNVCSNIFGSPREQYETLIQIAPNASERLTLDPETLSSQRIDVGFNAEMLERDFGWKSSYDMASAFEDYIRWLGNHDH